MKQSVSQKYTVAWFKLAEFISRGEKERALGLYRLLSHSFEDYALAHQLAGDILLSFNDQEAIEKYKAAAELYKKNGRFLEAIALYEQILLLTDAVLELIPLLVELYSQIGNQGKMHSCLMRYADYTIAQKSYTILGDFMRAQKQLFGTQAWFINMLAKLAEQHPDHKDYFVC